jgi:hypothetical protein
MNSNSNPSDLMKGAIANGVINAVINGIINWFTLDKEQVLYLTVDQISSTEHTVFAGAVPLAVSLAFILSSIAFFTLKIPEKPSYFPKVFILALKHSVYAFGLVTILGLLFQRFAGQIEVSHLTGAVIAGIIAGLTGGIVDFETKRSLFKS